MRLSDLLEMSAQDLVDAERVIEYLFRELNLDVVFTKHFKDRAIGGREDDVTKFELISAFEKLKKKFGDRLKKAFQDGKNIEAVLKDIANELNIPFALNYVAKGRPKYILRGITIMRKDPEKFTPNIAGGEELRV